MGRLVQARTLLKPENISQNPARTRKQISNPNHARKKTKVKLGLKNSAMLPNYFDYIFVHLRQKYNPTFLSTFGPYPAQTRPKKPGPTYNSGTYTQYLNCKILHGVTLLQP